jgi:hypothetical protein
MKSLLRATGALAIAVLSGCAGPDIAALSVLVMDQASGEVISGAKVVADTPSHEHPLSVESMLGQTGPMLKTGYTDSSGTAVVEYAVGRPVRIGVLARGYPLLIESIDQPWLGETVLMGDREGTKQLRARVEPTARRE